MELHEHLADVGRHLAATAALGDERTREIAASLAAAADPAVRLAIVSAISAAAAEITAALLDAPGAPAVAVRLDGDELRVEVRLTEVKNAPPPAGEDAELSARISLRLSEALKADIETAARHDSVSVNTWLVRAAAAHVSPAGRSGHDGGVRRDTHRITGWING